MAIPRLWALSAALGWYLAFTTGFAYAQAPACSCSFKEPPWEAYGTKAACSTIVRKGGTSCEIEFGGISTDPKVAAQVLGVNPTEYARQGYDVLGTFLQYLRDNKREALADPKFLAIALPIFMRGVYLSHPLSDDGISQARSLDAAIRSFSEKYSGQVSKVFLGFAPELKVTVNDANFTVGKGYLTVSSSFGFIFTRYMPAE
jgi:hypothetical protein